jgi:hypothetical protein
MDATMNRRSLGRRREDASRSTAGRKTSAAMPVLKVAGTRVTSMMTPMPLHRVIQSMMEKGLASSPRNTCEDKPQSRREVAISAG